VLVELSPLGAYALFGVPIHELTNVVADLTVILGRAGERIIEQLAKAPGWRNQCALLDRALTARAAAGPTPAPQVAHALRRLQRTAGRIPIATLAGEVGWSRRHLLTRFREQIGLPPATAARVIRFQRAARMLQQPDRPSLAEIAQRSGYWDQSHLNREFRALAEATPTELIVATPTCP
jgi:transcriptional regulator GlxA family with amidase domain